ncbi:MAG: PAS domain-containing sensor histidine kinase [Magnetococcales bacterium]|nr:PAS domain-containing sensor histidine kinase [Magnetococcales bacterium]
MLMNDTVHRMIIEHVPCGVIAFYSNGTVHLFNSAAERMFGYDKQDVHGRHISKLIPSLGDVLKETFNSQSSDDCRIVVRIPSSFEVRAVHRTGSPFLIRLAAYCIENCFFIIIDDIAVHRNIKDHSDPSEMEVIEQAPFGVVGMDHRQNVYIFNPMAERLFGYRKDEMVGRPASELFPRLISQFKEGMRYFLATGGKDLPGPESFEAEVIRKDGTHFPARLMVRGITVDGLPNLVVWVSDGTEEKRLYAELMQSEKMASLGNMVAGVAHEVNTPVGIGVTAASEVEELTRAFDELLHCEGISEVELEQYVTSMARLARLIRINLVRAADLVRSFKSVAVDQSSEKLRTFKVRDYVESAILALHPVLSRTKVVVVVVCDMNLEVRSFPGVLAQILINLVNNSLVHAFAPDEMGKITLEFAVVRHSLHFIYRDNGRGMSEEVLEHVFEPFFTTRRDLGGSGLGMAIVFNLVTRTLGGTISCESASGCGMAVQIDIPLSG